MTDKDLLLTVAEIAGVKDILVSANDLGETVCDRVLIYSADGKIHYKWGIPRFFESYDVTIPLVLQQKFTQEQWSTFFQALGLGGHSSMVRNYLSLLQRNPKQLCEALVKAHDKWKD